MLYALAFAALSAVPAQGGQLKLNNPRITIGELGPTRSSVKFLPGDILFFGYDISGLSIEADGTAKFKMEMKVVDKAGKAIFKQDARELSPFTPLRGNALPARAYLILGLDMEAGNYVLEITVEDPATKAKDTASVKFEVTKREFGVVNVYTSYDERGAISAPTSGFVGQTLYVQTTAVTFERDPTTKQPKIEFQYQFLDEKGNATLKEPFKRIVDGGVDEKEGLISTRIPLFMNRPGKYTVQITALDKIGNKKSTYDLPVTILPTN
jgi:hypothetical protein